MKTKFLFLSSMLIVLAVMSCKNATEVNEVPLCQRNVFSKNGVDTVKVYKYEGKMGEIDFNSKHLDEILVFDSLGNVVFYEGDGSDFFKPSSYCYEIGAYLERYLDRRFVLKPEYSDTSLIKVSVFEKSGEYIARIEHVETAIEKNDKIYVKDLQIFENKVLLDRNGRDSICYVYKLHKGKLQLEEKTENKYAVLEDGTERNSWISYYRDIFNPSKFETITGFLEELRDEKGRRVSLNASDKLKGSFSYSEDGLFEEEIFQNLFEGKNKTDKWVSQYYKNGLLKIKTKYSDMTIASEQIEYEYSFYPYSKAILE